MKRARTDLPPDIYPSDPWTIVEEAWAPDFLYLTETIFALSNGHLGVRGTLEEGTPAHAHGTFLNGFYESWPIHHPESAFGLAHTGQTIVNIPDPTLLELSVDGEILTAATARKFSRRLHFRTGALTRTSTWVLESGTTVSMMSRRIVSLIERSLIGIEMAVTTDAPVQLEIRSSMVNRQDQTTTDDPKPYDPRTAAIFEGRVLNPVAAHLEDLRVVQSWITTHSRLTLVGGIDHRFSHPPAPVTPIRQTDETGFRFEISVDPTRPLLLTKWAAYDEDRHVVEETLTRATGAGFPTMEENQQAALTEFWNDHDVMVETENPEIQRAIRWTLFQLHQAGARLDGYSIPAKGLTGQAYDGHFFWDTEIYVLPFLAATNPDAAASILRFRHRLLPAARRRAEELAQRGALYPWRTITGDEASAYFLAGTAQYHIDADIIHALRTYVTMTGDRRLLWEIGVEMAVETARMWADLGFYRDGRFHIHGVTGPDEYTALVDDNAYTNAMARMNLRYAARVVTEMAEEAPEDHATLVEALGLDPSEPTEWLAAAEAMFIPFDEQRRITPQDSEFLDKEPWDFAGTPDSMYPLLLHFHPLVIYRFQVLKQADVVLANFLLGEEFSPELKRANFDFYDAITTGDSSLSACIQSIMASEVGRPGPALEHFDRALFMDLADLAGNTTDGVHMASAGGVWLALVAGFGGVRIQGERLHVDPRLPAGWESLSFSTRFQGCLIRFRLTHDTLVVEPAGPVDLTIRGEATHIDATTVFPLRQ